MDGYETIMNGTAEVSRIVAFGHSTITCCFLMMGPLIREALRLGS